jgi:hypothetical protein
VGTRVKVGLEGGVHLLPAAHQLLFDPLDRLCRPTLGPTALGVVLEVDLKERLEHHLARLLDHAIPHRGNPQRPLTAVRLGTIPPPSRRRFVAPSPPVLCESLENLRHALTLHLCEAEAIDARAFSLRAFFLPGPPQHVGPVDAGIERVEPTVPTPLGRSVSPALELW